MEEEEEEEGDLGSRLEPQPQQEAPPAHDEDAALSLRPSSRRRGLYLPQEVVEYILRHTSLWACARLQLVSRTWAAAGRSALASAHRTPWMLLHTYDRQTSSYAGVMVSLSSRGGDGSFCKLPEVTWKDGFIGSCDGWLAFLEYYKVQPWLMNPFTKSRIDVPTLSRVPPRVTRTDEIPDIYPWSSSSTSGGDPARPAAVGCFNMMAWFTNGDLAMWRPVQGRWEWWKMQRFEHLPSVAAFKGEFNAIERTKGQVYVIDFQSSRLTPLGAVGLLPLRTTSGLRQLVEAHGELLLVCCTKKELTGVHRLDLSKREWVEVQSLGKHRVLFVSKAAGWRLPCSFSASWRRRRRRERGARGTASTTFKVPVTGQDGSAGQDGRCLTWRIEFPGCLNSRRVLLGK